MILQMTATATELLIHVLSNDVVWQEYVPLTAFEISAHAKSSLYEKFVWRIDSLAPKDSYN